MPPKQLYWLSCTILLWGFTFEKPILSVLGANWIFNEPRTMRVVFEDMLITHQISQKLSDDLRFEKHANIVPIVYNHVVILAGQVPNVDLKQDAYAYATKVSNVKQVFNEMIIHHPTTPWRRIQDAYITLKVRTQLLLTPHIRYHHFHIETENGVVFILGKTNAHAAHIVGSIAQQTKAVLQVKRLIEPE